LITAVVAAVAIFVLNCQGLNGTEGMMGQKGLNGTKGEKVCFELSNAFPKLLMSE